MAGLTSLGFSVLRLADIVAGLKDRLRLPTAFGPSFVTEDGSPQGQIVGVLAIPIARVWEVCQAIYDAFNPSNAAGVLLDNVVAYVGVAREPATKSQVTLTLTGTPSTVIPLGSIVRIENGARWLTKAEATIPAGGGVDVAAEAEFTGLTEGAADTITEIVTAVAGWDTATNDEAAAPGRNLETDAELRVRWARSHQIVGAGPDQAIRARLEALTDVDHAAVISNRTLAPDPTSQVPDLPGAKFIAIVYPDTADGDSVAQAIWETMPSGIGSYGDESRYVTDDNGYQVEVCFQYAEAVNIHVKIDDLMTNHLYPADGDDQVAEAVVDFGETLGPGATVWPYRIAQAVMTAVPGVDHLEVLVKVDGTPSAADNDPIEINPLKYADIAIGNVTVEDA